VRLAVFLAGYLAMTGLIGWRLVDIQVLSADEYRSLGERQLQREVALPAARGRLYDRSGEPLAMSQAAATVYADPQAIRRGDADPDALAAQLAPLLGSDRAELAERLGSDAGFVYLARQLPRGVGEQVRELGLPGVGVIEEPARTYPSLGLAGQVVGFAGVDNTGLAGLELQYDDILAGRDGRVRTEAAPGGLHITGAPRAVERAVPGSDLVLTIDRQIQWATEEVLASAMERYEARGASAVVLDVASGEVLAMASVPSFDPERIGDSDDYARRNRAVTDVFEPGSVNKVVTAAAALEEGLVTPTERFTVPDSYTVGDKRFRDALAQQPRAWSFRDVIAQSSNVGTIMIAERLGEDRLHHYLGLFGYGQRSGLGFPGETAGLLPPIEGWWDTSLPTIAIGQGVSATLLQVAGVFQVVASGGEWTAPTLVRGTVDADGRLEPAAAPERRRAVSPATAAQLAELLVGVVEEGTGAQAAVPGYDVAGKTGTAQKPSETSRGYQEDAYIATFAGFAPAEDPALVVAVMLDEPTPHWGSQTAAPTFSEIMSFALGHSRVVPSDPDARSLALPAGARERAGE
jgi:cell division protein FtsI (penicillin-binding protein 3)